MIYLFSKQKKLAINMHNRKNTTIYIYKKYLNMSLKLNYLFRKNDTRLKKNVK